MVHIAIVGDVHTHLNQFDVDYFNQSDYSLILFVGDLANYRHRDGIRAARQMAQLTKPTLYLPGNHDGVHALQLLAEIKQAHFWINQFSPGQNRRMKQLQTALGSVACAGYSTHSYMVNGRQFDVIAGRPFAMGGSQISYQPYLSRKYGVRTLEQSVEKINQCVDAAKSNTLLFLAHNGPTQLGSKRTDIWGCDFRAEAGDFGDQDLRLAIAYAKSQGKDVLAVLAGHMHHALKGGGQRDWHLVRDGTHYVNAARVPRIFTENGRLLHHHVRYSLDANGLVEVKPLFVEE